MLFFKKRRATLLCGDIMIHSPVEAELSHWWLDIHQHNIATTGSLGFTFPVDGRWWGIGEGVEGTKCRVNLGLDTLHILTLSRWKTQQTYEVVCTSEAQLLSNIMFRKRTLCECLFPVHAPLQQNWMWLVCIWQIICPYKRRYKKYFNSEQHHIDHMATRQGTTHEYQINKKLHCHVATRIH